jgi:hypothetical protein
MIPMERREEAYEFLETLAPALYAHGIKIHLDTLQNIVHDRGVNYESGDDMGKVVCAASRYWEHKDPAIRHAIGHSFAL